MQGTDKFLDPYQQTLGRIYDAAFSRTAFAQLSDVLTKAMQAANGVVVVSQNGLPVDLSATTSRQAQQEYLSYYGRIDVWTPPPFALPDFAVTRSQDRVPDRVVLNSEFYRDYARHLDMWHPIGLTCSLGSDLSLMIGLNRTRAGRDFGNAEHAHLIDLAHHVQRALQMRRHFQGLENQARAGHAILDRLAFAVVITDGDARISFANSKAEDLERSGVGLILSGRRLGTPSPRHALYLSNLIRDAATGGAGGATRLSEGNGAGSLLALVTPLPQRLREHETVPVPVLVAIRRESDSPAFAESMVAQLFGLSPAETEVVCALAAGATLEEIALKRGVKMTTIKTQIEAVFRKTGTESQRDLTRLLGILPQLG